MSSPKTTLSGWLALLSGLSAALVAGSEHVQTIVGKEQSPKVIAGAALASLLFSAAGNIFAQDNTSQANVPRGTISDVATTPEGK